MKTEGDEVGKLQKEIDFDQSSFFKNQILPNKEKVLELLREALKTDLRAKLVQEINDEINQMEMDLQKQDELKLIESMQKAYEFTLIPTWARHKI